MLSPSMVFLGATEVAGMRRGGICGARPFGMILNTLQNAPPALLRMILGS